MFEVGDNLQNGGVIESDELICGGCGVCGDRLFCDEVPLQVPPVAESHCKFRLWKCLRLATVCKTADGKESENLMCDGCGGCCDRFFAAGRR